MSSYNSYFPSNPLSTVSIAVGFKYWISVSKSASNSQEKNMTTEKLCNQLEDSLQPFLGEDVPRQIFDEAINVIKGIVTLRRKLDW